MDQSRSSEPIKHTLLMVVESGALREQGTLDRKLRGVLPGPKICALAVAQLSREPRLGRHSNK